MMAGQTLSTLSPLCDAMKEARTPCRRLLDRLQAAEPVLNRTKTTDFVKVADQFHEFLEKHRAKELVCWVVEFVKMMEELRQFNTIVDGFYKLDGKKWRRHWGEDRVEWLAMLSTAVNDRDFIYRELQNPRKQLEALLTLQFISQEQSEQDGDFIRVLTDLKHTIEAVFPTRVGRLQWFIPLCEISFQQNPFAQGPIGTLHRGVWAGDAVVVKRFLVDEMVMNERMRIQLEREMQARSELGHLNIVKMIGGSHVSVPPFIVREDAANGDLGSFLARSADNKQRVWALIYHAALGLEYLHSCGLVHGNLTLNNILVGAAGQAKISDYGLTALRTCSNLSLKSTGVSSLRWCAPERLRRRASFASDVYSLAMCMIEAVSGEPPFAFLSEDEVREAIRRGEIPERPKELTDDLWQLIVSMTSIDPNERPKIGDVVCKLKSSGESEPIQDELAIETSVELKSEELVAEFPSAQDLPNSSVSADVSSPQGSELGDLNNDTPVPELLKRLRCGSGKPQRKALLFLVQLCADEEQRKLLYEDNGIPLLIDLVRSADTYFEQLCALGCLCWAADPDSRLPVEMYEDLQSDIRAATPDECSYLVSSLGSGNDWKRFKAVVCCASIADLCSPHTLHEAGVVPPLIAALVEGSSCIKLWAAHALGNLVDSEEISDGIIRNGAIAPLVDILEHGDASQKGLAAYALGRLALRSASSAKIAKQGAIMLLATMLQSGTDVQKGYALFALSRLADSDANKKRMLRYELLEPILELLRAGTPTQKEHAAYAVASFAEMSAVRKGIASNGVIVALVRLLKAKAGAPKEHAAYALGCLADNNVSRKKIKEAGAIRPLLALAQTGTDKQKYHGLSALALLADSDTNKRAFVEAGAIPVLVEALHTEEEAPKVFAMSTLVRLAKLYELNVVVGQAGAVTAMMKIMETGGELLKEKAIIGLNCFAACRENRRIMVEGGVIELLVGALATGTNAHKSHAAYCVAYLADIDADCAARIARCGAISQLLALLRSGTNAQKANAAFALGSLAKADGNNIKKIKEGGGMLPLSTLLWTGTDAQRARASNAMEIISGNTTSDEPKLKRRRSTD